MIKSVIDILNANDFYGISERVEIAKGKYAFPNGWKNASYKIKRYSKIKKEHITWKDIWNKIK